MTLRVLEYEYGCNLCGYTSGKPDYFFWIFSVEDEKLVYEETAAPQGAEVHVYESCVDTIYSLT